MTYQFPADVSELVQERMASGFYESEDDLLRHALQALAEEEEDLAAVKEAIAGFEAGDEGIPLNEAFDEVRRKHGIS